MSYCANELEENTMRKTELFSSEEQVNDFIRESRDEKKLTWQEIADELKSMGYRVRVGKSKGKPLHYTSVRNRYYQPHMGGIGSKVGSVISTHHSPAQSRAVELIRAAIKMKTDADSKVEFIEQILENYK